MPDRYYGAKRPELWEWRAFVCRRYMHVIGPSMPIGGFHTRAGQGMRREERQVLPSLMSGPRNAQPVRCNADNVGGWFPLRLRRNMFEWKLSQWLNLGYLQSMVYRKPTDLSSCYSCGRPIGVNDDSVLFQSGVQAHQRGSIKAVVNGTRVGSRTRRTNFKLASREWRFR